MADEDIVQKVVIEVDDTALAKAGEDAKQSFGKLKAAAADAGPALQGMQAAAGQVGAGVQKLPPALADVTQKTVVTTREMRALGTVMRTVGEGAAASAAVGFVKIGATLGPIGIALFAAAEAFKFIKGRMEEAEKAAKAVIETMANIAKTSAEMKVDDQAVFWRTTAAAIKEAANDYKTVAAQMKNIIAGGHEVIDSLTSQETQVKAFVKVLEDAGININNVAADTKMLSQESYQASLKAAQLYEKMSPIEKLNFEKALKSLGFPDETIKSIEKGTAALKQARAEAEASSWENWAPAFRKLGEALTSAAASVAAFSADLDKRFANVLNADVQMVKDAFNSITQSIVDAFNAVLDPVKSVFDKIGGWIKSMADAAKALWSALTGSGASVSAPSAPGMARGGVVTGGGGIDTIPALLTRGEYVINAAAVQRVGVGFLHSVNALQTPRMALGGLVGATAGTGSPASSRNLHLTIEGRTFGPMSAAEDTASALERFAVHSQLASIGRSQSWRR